MEGRVPLGSGGRLLEALPAPDHGAAAPAPAAAHGAPGLDGQGGAGREPAGDAATGARAASLDLGTDPAIRGGAAGRPRAGSAPGADLAPAAEEPVRSPDPPSATAHSESCTWKWA
jgi:hypothetical protein